MCLQGACSLQNFDALSDGAGVGGSSGDAGLGGSSQAGDGAVAGRGGAGSSLGGAGRGGSGGNAGSSAGGSAGVSGGGAGGAPTGGSAGAAAGDAGASRNLLSDPSFEAGHAEWLPFGDASLADAPGEGRDGTQCLVATGRTQTYEGPSIDLTAFVEPGALYLAEAWIRTSSAEIQPVALTIKKACAGEVDAYVPVANALAPAGEWVYASGELTAATCSLTEYRLYVEGAAVGVDLYVDDVGLYRVP